MPHEWLSKFRLKLKALLLRRRLERVGGQDDRGRRPAAPLGRVMVAVGVLPARPVAAVAVAQVRGETAAAHVARLRR